MPSQSQLAKARRQQANAAFGRMLRRWRELNGWSQYVAEDWCLAAGDFELVSHGALSPLENGKTPNPRPPVFAHFAEINRRLAAQDFHGVKSHELLARLAESRPMLDDDGNLLQEEMLMGIHCGVRRVPARYWVPEVITAPAITQEAADALCLQWRQTIADEAKRREIGWVRCLGDLGELAPEQHREQFQDVLAEASTYTTEQLQGLWDGSSWAPTAWIEAWIASLPASRQRSGGGGGVIPRTQIVC